MPPLARSSTPTPPVTATRATSRPAFGAWGVTPAMAASFAASLLHLHLDRGLVTAMAALLALAARGGHATGTSATGPLFVLAEGVARDWRRGGGDGGREATRGSR